MYNQKSDILEWYTKQIIKSIYCSSLQPYSLINLIFIDVSGKAEFKTELFLYILRSKHSGRREEQRKERLH